jgi:trigger factor
VTVKDTAGETVDTTEFYPRPEAAEDAGDADESADDKS